MTYSLSRAIKTSIKPPRTPCRSNYAFGFTAAPLSAFVAATAAGSIPSSLAYVSSGTLGAEMIVRGSSYAGRPGRGQPEIDNPSDTAPGAGSAGPHEENPWLLFIGAGAAAASVYACSRLAADALRRRGIALDTHGGRGSGAVQAGGGRVSMAA